MKRQTSILIILLAALIIVAAFSAFTGMSSPVADNLNGTSTATGSSLGESREVCFSGSYTVIRATLNSDQSVTGTLNFTPPEKDSLTGTFTGVWAASATATGLDILHAYAAEGVNATERRTLVINDSYAQIDWDGPGPIGISSERIPKVACAQAPVGSKSYASSLFGFSFGYPSDFSINSANIDAATSTAAGFASGAAYVQLNGIESSSGRQQKIELMLRKAEISDAEFAKKNVSKESIASSGVTWYMSRESVNGSQSVQASAQKNGVSYVMTGFTFNGAESSVYSEELKGEMAGIIRTFRIK